MKSKTFYQLMNVSKTGVETPLLVGPGMPVDLFELKREAIAYAEEHPDLIRHGRFTVKPVMLLQDQSAEVEGEVVVIEAED